MTRVARALAVAAAVAAADHADAKQPLAPGEKIDLNTAPIAELMRLPGIGRKRAESIVALREKRPLRRPEDLAQVKGISPSWVSKHRALLGAAPPAAAPAAAPNGAKP